MDVLDGMEIPCTACQIITNNIPREVLYFYDLPESEFQEGGEFDWMDQEQKEWGKFFKFMGSYYSLQEFGRIRTRTYQAQSLDHHALTVEDNSPLANWDGYSLSAGSGLLLKWTKGGEIIMGRWNGRLD